MEDTSLGFLKPTENEYYDIGTVNHNTQLANDLIEENSSAIGQKLDKSGDEMGGTLAFDRGVSKFKSYKDVLHYTNGSSIFNGTLKITLPKSWTWSMLFGCIRGYNHGNLGAWVLDFGGYTDDTSKSWVNVSARVSGKVPFDKVRFAHDGQKCCILIGDLSTSWKYVRFSITDFVASLDDSAGWESGWAAEIIKSEVGITSILEAELQGVTPKETVITSGFAAGWSGQIRYSVTSENKLFISYDIQKNDADITTMYNVYTMPSGLRPRNGIPIPLDATRSFTLGASPVSNSECFFQVVPGTGVVQVGTSGGAVTANSRRVIGSLFYDL